MKFVAMMMVAGVGVGAVGCAAETSAPPEEKVGQTSQALTNYQQSQHDAQVVLAAIFGGDLHGVPTLADGPLGPCTKLRNDITAVEADIASGVATVVNAGPTTVDGLQAISYAITDGNGLTVAMIANHAGLCFQKVDGSYYVTDFLFLGSSGNTVYVDPASAQLTQNLSSWKGASAAATDVATNATVTAWQWPSSPSTGGSFAGGEPCSSVALSAGQTTSASIQKSGSSLQYSTCK